MLSDKDELLRRKLDRVKSYRSSKEARDYFWKIEVPSFSHHLARYYKNIDLIIAAYALFLFFILLLKDITKDLKNLVGDFTENYQTIPVVFGEDFSRIIISLITFINVILIINLFINFSDGYMNIYYGISLILLLIFTIKLYKSKKVSDYLELHNILRLIIGLGVFSIILLEI